MPWAALRNLTLGSTRSSLSSQHLHISVLSLGNLPSQNSTIAKCRPCPDFPVIPPCLHGDACSPPHSEPGHLWRAKHPSLSWGALPRRWWKTRSLSSCTCIWKSLSIIEVHKHTHTQFTFYFERILFIISYIYLKNDISLTLNSNVNMEYPLKTIMIALGPFSCTILKHHSSNS